MPKSTVKFDKIEIIPAQVVWSAYTIKIVAGNLNNTLIKLSAKEHREDLIKELNKKNLTSDQ